MKKGWKIVFVLGLVGHDSVSIIVVKYNIFHHATPSACTVGILNTLKYTEFDGVTLLAML